ncbi:hypothetical protein ACLB2K_011930 [Fragaria x ananassa]
MHFSIDIYERTGCKRTVAPAIQGHQRSTFTNNTKRLCGRPRKSGTAAEHTANGESSNNTKRHRGRQRVSDNAAEQRTLQMVNLISCSSCRIFQQASVRSIFLLATTNSSWKIQREANGKQAVLLAMLQSNWVHGGWIGFARDNGVEIGDDCLFELESKSKTVVHIIKK